MCTIVRKPISTPMAAAATGTATTVAIPSVCALTAAAIVETDPAAAPDAAAFRHAWRMSARARSVSVAPATDRAGLSARRSRCHATRRLNHPDGPDGRSSSTESWSAACSMLTAVIPPLSATSGSPSPRTGAPMFVRNGLRDFSH